MEVPAIGEPSSDGRRLYLDLLKGCLTRMLFPDGTVNGDLSFNSSFNRQTRIEGRDWPAHAETMVGLRRLDNIEECVIDVIQRDIPGDLVEAGVWRGGASIMMRAVLAAYGDLSRRVWLADSFQGLPVPDSARYPADAGDRHWELSSYLSVPLQEVQENFRRYELLDDQVQFLVGWFKDTLPTAPISSIAVLRVDGDMYQSTLEVLSNLYHKVSLGGYVIIDDYGNIPSCRAAVHDFRESHNVREEIERIDWTGVFWRKEAVDSVRS
jgi:O-methyltransferase